MKNIDLHIGNIIAEILEELGMTKAELARKLDIKPQSVDYLLKRQSIDTNALYNISMALNYDLSKLFSITKEQTNSDNKINDEPKKTVKVLLEIELDEADISKLNIKNRVVRMLN
jgi:transcriptional regulator with XRE-family HTH domain